MNDVIYDEKLWFELRRCPGKHYLLGNPHTFRGRIMAWCPTKEKSLFVSKQDMIHVSPESQYWIAGFLAGNELAPPVNAESVVDYESAAYKHWQEEIAEFHHTGYWNENQESVFTAMLY